MKGIWHSYLCNESTKTESILKTWHTRPPAETLQAGRRTQLVPAVFCWLQPLTADCEQSVKFIFSVQHLISTISAAEVPRRETAEAICRLSQPAYSSSGGDRKDAVNLFNVALQSASSSHSALFAQKVHDRTPLSSC